jgi:hypothetical protein
VPLSRWDKKPARFAGPNLRAANLDRDSGCCIRGSHLAAALEAKTKPAQLDAPNVDNYTQNSIDKRNTM